MIDNCIDSMVKIVIQEIMHAPQCNQMIVQTYPTEEIAFPKVFVVSFGPNSEVSLRYFEPDKWGWLHGMRFVMNVQSASLCLTFKHKSLDQLQF